MQRAAVVDGQRAGRAGDVHGLRRIEPSDIRCRQAAGPVALAVILRKHRIEQVAFRQYR